MKIIQIGFLYSTLPLLIGGLVLHSSDSSPNLPEFGCADEADSDSEDRAAYDTAYLKSFYDAISFQLAGANNQVLEQFRKSDLNGDGKLDCSELMRIKQQYDPDHQEAETDAKESEEQQEEDNNVPAPPTSSDHLEMLKADAAKAEKRAERKEEGDKGCKPTCTWSCGTHSCDQVCSPKCNTPQCQTRCTGMATTGCVMKCGKPRCSSICQSTPCAKKDCPACKTQCSKPLCKLVCPAGVQNCHDVCESPACSWICKRPLACPKPACTLKCDSPRACKEGAYKPLPALKDGEAVVQSFEMPLSLQQQMGESGKLMVPVPVTQAVAVPGSMELKMERSTVRLPIVMDL